MPSPLGVRVCAVLTCGRRIHVSEGGTVYARCDMHTAMLTRDAFAASGWSEDDEPLTFVPHRAPTPRDAPRTPATRSGLTSAHRGRPDAALTASPGR